LMNILSYLANIGFLLFYCYILYRYTTVQLFLNTWKEIVVNYMCSGTHLYYYLHIIGLIGLVRMVDLLVFWNSKLLRSVNKQTIKLIIYKIYLLSSLYWYFLVW
jgi:hypothetical protein